MELPSSTAVIDGNVYLVTSLKRIIWSHFEINNESWSEYAFQYILYFWISLKDNKLNIELYLDHIIYFLKGRESLNQVNIWATFNGLNKFSVCVCMHIYNIYVTTIITEDDIIWWEKEEQII